MSNHLAIAAVTRAIANRLSNNGELDITTVTPDIAARDNSGSRRVNLFLYHTMPNPAWRNRDIPGRLRPGERGNPPLALNLYYLLTAYGEDGNNVADQQILGRAMQVLHDNPVLRPTEIVRSAASLSSEMTPVNEQIENVRIAPDTLNIEEMSRLWTTFQTQYRVSAAYQAAVVLIDSNRPTRSALPVARRGEQDRGVLAGVGIDAVLEGVEYRAISENPQLPAARVGDTLLLVGKNLPGTNVSAVIRDPKAEPVNGNANSDLVATLKTSVVEAGGKLQIELDPDVAVWPAGLLSVELQYPRENRQASSNSVSLALAPSIQTSDVGQSAIAFINEDDERRILQVSMKHPLGEKRRVLMVLNRFLATDSRPTTGMIDEAPVDSNMTFFQISQLPDNSGLGTLNPSFDVTNVPPGTYWIRIRVDGVDSMLMQLNFDENNKPSVSFDEKQKVTI